MNSLDDANESEFSQLITQARSGDAEALGQLVERYRKYLLFIANRQLDAGFQAKFGASDVVQESMIHAQTNFQKFHGNAELEFRNWLNAILTNDLRKAKRHFSTQGRTTNREVKPQDRSEIVASIRDPQLTPSSEAMNRETSETLNRALAKLSSNEKRIINLRNVERLTFMEIGREMGTSEDAARKRWARAIESLQRFIFDEGTNSSV